MCKFILLQKKRGEGLGKKLHEYALNFFRNNGVDEYHLRVSPSNKQAIAYYKKNGMLELKSELVGKVIRMKGII
ncbi:GNAT family N-acetyltransferase [Peribacillus sp. FSL P2-0133]|uniref:GNAT family N-acetyltransferase n=1 Tax=Peribacillus sp. FSL P2-0133 TaxID=2921573 RepID=UPI0030D4F76F